MGDISTVTKTEFEDALEEMANNNDIDALWMVFKSSPEHLRPKVDSALLGMVKKVTAKFDEVDDFPGHVEDVFEGSFSGQRYGFEFDYFHDILKDQKPGSGITHELYIEIAVIASCESSVYADHYLQQATLSDTDRKRIIASAMLALDKDVEEGYLSSIISLLSEDVLLPEQRERIYEGIQTALGMDSEEEPELEDVSAVLSEENVPMEFRKIALKRCSELGGVLSVLRAMDNENSGELFSGREDERVIEALGNFRKKNVNCSERLASREICKLIEASKSEKLPDEATQLISSTLQMLLDKIEADDKLSIDEIEKKLDSERVPPIVRSVVENCFGRMKCELANKEKPEPTAFGRAMAYIKQARDQGQAGMMEPPKRRAGEKAAGKPKLKA